MTKEFTVDEALIGEPPAEAREPRQFVVVDLESNGLDFDKHTAVEVAWWNLNTGEQGCFVPVHDVSTVLANASIKALQINRYVDRLADAEQDVEGLQLLRLAEVLRGNTMVGSNPAFDSAMLRKLMPDRKPTWHYRLLDIGAYAAGVLALPPERGVPGLWETCQLLNVELREDVAHTAMGDVIATGECLVKLQSLARSHALCHFPQRIAFDDDETDAGHIIPGRTIEVPGPADADWAESLRPVGDATLDMQPVPPTTQCECCQGGIETFRPVDDKEPAWCGRNGCDHSYFDHETKGTGA